MVKTHVFFAVLTEYLSIIQTRFRRGLKCPPKTENKLFKSNYMSYNKYNPSHSFTITLLVMYFSLEIENRSRNNLPTNFESQILNFTAEETYNSPSSFTYMEFRMIYFNFCLCNNYEFKSLCETGQWITPIVTGNALIIIIMQLL
jgi:hypothetical protein